MNNDAQPTNKPDATQVTEIVNIICPQCDSPDYRDQYTWEDPYMPYILKQATCVSCKTTYTQEKIHP